MTADLINICMANIDPVFSNIPAVTGAVDYAPLGGEVGLQETNKQDILDATLPNPGNIEASNAIEAGYGAPGDGPVLNHVRRRNLGLI